MYLCITIYTVLREELSVQFGIVLVSNTYSAKRKL